MSDYDYAKTWCNSQREWVAKLMARTESPLEGLLLSALVIQSDEDGEYVFRPSGSPVLVPQHRVKIDEQTYRLDFAIGSKEVKIAIEVDGHEAHASTELAIRGTRDRQSALANAGWVVLPFPGHAISEDPRACACAVVEEWNRLSALHLDTGNGESIVSLERKIAGCILDFPEIVFCSRALPYEPIPGALYHWRQAIASDMCQRGGVEDRDADHPDFNKEKVRRSRFGVYDTVFRESSRYAGAVGAWFPAFMKDRLENPVYQDPETSRRDLDMYITQLEDVMLRPASERTRSDAQKATKEQRQILAKRAVQIASERALCFDRFEKKKLG